MLRIALLHAFKCKICQATPFTPLIILAKCLNMYVCGTLVPMPLTKIEDVQTTILHGLDEITAEGRKLFKNLDQADGQEFPIVNITQGGYNGHSYFGDSGRQMIRMLNNYHLRHDSRGSDCAKKLVQTTKLR